MRKAAMDSASFGARRKKNRIFQWLVNRARNRGKTPGQACIYGLRRLGRLRFMLCLSPFDNLDGLSSAQLLDLVAGLLAKVAAVAASFHQRLEHGISTILVELDADSGP